jgi:hypothetical protein
MPEATGTTDRPSLVIPTGLAEPVAPDRLALVAGTPSGLIYESDERPSVQELLAPYRVLLPDDDRSADVIVLDGPHTIVPSVKRGAEAIVTAALTGATSAVGILLLVSTVITGHIRVNPFLALMLAIGGFGLTATLAVTVKHAGGDQTPE